MTQEFYAVIGAGICIVFALALLCWSATMTILAVQARHDTPKADALTYRLRELATWCGYEFPIVEDVQEFVLNGGRDFGGFRTELRGKYGRESQ